MSSGSVSIYRTVDPKDSEGTKLEVPITAEDMHAILSKDENFPFKDFIIKEKSSSGKPKFPVIELGLYSLTVVLYEEWPMDVKVWVIHDTADDNIIEEVHWETSHEASNVNTILFNRVNKLQGALNKVIKHINENTANSKEII